MNDKEINLLKVIFKNTPTINSKKLKITSNGILVPYEEIKQVYDSVHTPNFLVRMWKITKKLFS